MTAHGDDSNDFGKIIMKSLDVSLVSGKSNSSSCFSDSDNAIVRAAKLEIQDLRKKKIDEIVTEISENIARTEKKRKRMRTLQNVFKWLSLILFAVESNAVAISLVNTAFGFLGMSVAGIALVASRVTSRCHAHFRRRFEHADESTIQQRKTLLTLAATQCRISSDGFITSKEFQELIDMSIQYWTEKRQRDMAFQRGRDASRLSVFKKMFASSSSSKLKTKNEKVGLLRNNEDDKAFHILTEPVVDVSADNGATDLAKTNKDILENAENSSPLSFSSLTETSPTRSS